jgi:NADH-dependent peroxiredoxin subunit F
MTATIYDAIIIGGGPAGSAAAIYAARKKLKTLMIAESFGGQSMVSAKIENWIGELEISGVDLAEKLKKHVQAQPDVEIRMPERISNVTQMPDCTFEVKTQEGGAYTAKTLIIASGASRRRLNVSGEDKFDGKGVAFCSTCDAPIFVDLDVAVVGSGNSALETVIDLLPYARRIDLLIRGEELKGDPIHQDKVRVSPKFHLVKNAEVAEVLGNHSVTGLRYRDSKTGETRQLAAQGVFVQVGLTPNSGFIRELVDTNQNGEIIVRHETAETSKPGIFAAGDVTSDPYKQNNISAGDGVRAALSAYNYILNIKKYSPCADREG